MELKISAESSIYDPTAVATVNTVMAKPYNYSSEKVFRTDSPCLGCPSASRRGEISTCCCQFATFKPNC